MKKIKLIVACFAVAFCFNLSSSAQEVKTGDTKKETLSKDDVDTSAKTYTSEMTSAIGITDESKIKTIASLNSNYETSVAKAVAKGNLSTEEVEDLKAKLDKNRDLRFEGILTPTEMKSYRSWKATKALEEMDMPSKTKSSGNTAKPSPKKSNTDRPVKK